MLKVYDLRTEYINSPVGIDTNPRFSWKITGDKRGIIQKAYSIEIAEDINFSDMIFTKKEDSGRSLANVFEELQLKSVTKYYWRVKVYTKDEESDYSNTAYFVTGYFDKKEWLAQFISAETEADADNSRGTFVRHEFCVEKPVKSAYLAASALGLYNVFLDGSKVGNDELTPGWTSYKNHLCYQLYDVSDALREAGKHVIYASLGAGYYKGTMGFLMRRNNYGKCTAFISQLHINYEDGTEAVILSNESWTSGASPVIFSEIYDGEIYDARLLDEAVFKKDYDESGLKKVNVIEYDRNTLISQPGSRVKEMEKLPAKSIFTTKEGDTVIDFGQNHAGWIHVVIDNAKAGDVVELDCFESLDANGNVYIDNLRGAKNRFVYYCRGGHEEYHPHFTYQGYRYAKVSSWAGDALSKDRVCAFAVYSDMDKTGDFSCSNKDINQLWSNITWSLRSNFVDIPTDCPQRNERVGWTGDAQIFCRTASYIRNTFIFFEKWLKDVAYDQTKEGGVPHVVPDLITPMIGTVNDWLCSKGSHSAAAWADVAVINPWIMYLTYGDTKILEDQYESMKKWINFMRDHADGIIWNYRLQFGDWVALDAEEGSYFGATPNDLTCTAYYAYSTGLFAKIADILGRSDDAEEYGNLEKKIKAGFADKFFDENTKGMKVKTQTAHIVALFFDLTPEEYKENTVKELKKLLAKENGHLVTGFVGTPYFTHALSQNGCLKEAYELLLKDDYPSWLYQVKQGATTIWEHWDGLKPDGSMWSADMNSFNHYAYGSIGEWLIRVVAGIDIDEKDPAYHHALLYPRPGGGLSYAAGEYESVYGRLVSRWEIDGSEITLRITVPANTTASLRVDEASEILDDDEIQGVIEGSVYRAELVSGEYTIRLKRENQ